MHHMSAAIMACSRAALHDRQHVGPQMYHMSAVTRAGPRTSPTSQAASIPVSKANLVAKRGAAYGWCC
jgi:hypothetical protein